MSVPLDEFQVLSFDCYGTLIDWETGIWNALQPVFADSGADRGTVLQCFGRLESELQSTTPDLAYPQVLEGVHAALAELFGLDSTAEFDAAFGASVGDWPPFPDTAEALDELAHRRKLVILSNVDRGSFAASSRLLGVTFDAVLTAQDLGSYKPDPRNFARLIEHVQSELGVAPDRLLHVAQSVYHDLVPAKEAGLTTVWIDRQGQASGDGAWGATRAVADLPDIDHRFNSLAELAAAMRGA